MAGLLSRYGKRENPEQLTTLFFARLGNTMKEEALKAVCEQHGRVDDVTLVCDRETKKSKGCAFVKFATPDDAEKCLQYFTLTPTDLHWVVEWAKSTQIRDSDLDKKTLYVTGIATENANETNVYDHFSVYGVIEKVTVVGKNKDFPVYAFVKFVDERGAEKALKNENGREWGGSSLVVQFSETLESKKSRRVRRQPASTNYVSVESPRLVRHVPKEGSDNNGSFLTLLSALTLDRDDMGFGDVLLRPPDRSANKIDSPLLRDYERLIHQLDDEDDLFPDANPSDAPQRGFSIFADDAQWGEFHHNN